MYQRIVFGELSDFLAGLGDHLTDIEPVEILTLAPLGALVVIFGIQPGLVLNLFRSTVTETLNAVQPAPAIAIPTEIVVAVVGLVVVGILARVGWALMRRAPTTAVTAASEGGAAH
jgi:hypothetical protein